MIIAKTSFPIQSALRFLRGEPVSPCDSIVSGEGGEIKRRAEFFAGCYGRKKKCAIYACQEENRRKSGKDSLQLAENTEYSWKRRKIYLQTVLALRYAYPMEAVASQ
ncbi:MAG: hypothetical protein KBH49_05010 [Faecalibacterium sp.]|nr:hypothetical protein [Faecalibacterium sp.]